MKNESFSASYLVDKSPEEIFNAIIDVREWWSGLYGEVIEGSSNKVNDEFTFRAGDGVHYSKQRLVEITPYTKIVWLVTESELSFVDTKDEWTGTKLCFDIAAKEAGTEVTFTHLGLVPAFECYDGCAGAWSQYLELFLAPLATSAKSTASKMS